MTSTYRDQISILLLNPSLSVPEPLEYQWFVGNLTAADLPGKDISPRGLQITQIVAMCVGMFAMGLTVDLKKMLKILKRPWECVQMQFLQFQANYTLTLP